MSVHARKRLPVIEAAIETVRASRRRDAVRPELACAVVVVLAHGERAYAKGLADSADLRMLCQILLALTAALPPGEDRSEVRR
jgi:hypothetical protein